MAVPVRLHATFVQALQPLLADLGPKAVHQDQDLSVQTNAKDKLFYAR